MDINAIIAEARQLVESSTKSAVALYVENGMTTTGLFHVIAIDNKNLPLLDTKANNFSKENNRKGITKSQYNLFRTDDSSDWTKDDDGNYKPVDEAKADGSKFAFMAEHYRIHLSRTFQMTESGKFKSANGLLVEKTTKRKPRQQNNSNKTADNKSFTAKQVQDLLQVVVDKYRGKSAYTKAIEAFVVDFCAQADINRPKATKAD